ncbi:MAG TPA: hypothetical protein VHB54_17695, partial [Mucilaginibacter sp.]|nr:hypothetical protein [Mucilaginibacter sp.]
GRSLTTRVPCANYYNIVFPKHSSSMFHVERTNLLQLPDVPRGTFNNDINATNAQTPSKTIKG